MKKNTAKPTLHPRNPFGGRYDMSALSEACADLIPFLRLNPSSQPTIDFSDPAAVETLNRALLQHTFGIKDWTLPPGYLCPPVPGRLDYLLHLEDLLNGDQRTIQQEKGSKNLLDIGTGASCIYPLLGHAALGWSFTATDIDPLSLDNCLRILQANPDFQEAIELRLNTAPESIFNGIVNPGDRFDACICNPPFYTGPEEAAASSKRKSYNLHGRQTPSVQRNFGGQAGELWCEGGEGKFVSTMVRESVAYAKNIRWFSSLVSKESNLEGIRRALKSAKPKQVKEIHMGQGNKVSRIVAWSFC